MPHEVIMPALGMTQDTGLLVAWLKREGDAVAEGDALFEVETDKTTMEVPADRDGFLAATYAEAGDEVPVGDVIAVISAERPEASVAGAAAAPSSRSDASPPPEPEPRAAEPRAAEAPVSPARPASDRVLASPKARRLARERNIDLSRLAAAGVAQPFHAADLDRPEAREAPVPAAPPRRPARLSVTARAPAAPLEAFEAEMGSDRTALLAALAAGALRSVTQAGHVAVELRPAERRLDDPDLPRPRPDDRPVSLILRDLSATRLTGVGDGAAAIPCITVTRDGADLSIALGTDPEAMDEARATAFLAELADRIADPLRQLF